MADALAMAVGSASLRLRILHEEGFIEPAEDAAHDRRSSYWRAIPGGIRFELTGDHENDPQYKGAVAQARVLLEDRRTVMNAQWRNQQSIWSQDWLEASTELDTMIQLDSAQAAELSAEVMAVIKRWKEAHPSPDSQTVFVTC